MNSDNSTSESSNRYHLRTRSNSTGSRIPVPTSATLNARQLHAESNSIAPATNAPSSIPLLNLPPSSSASNPNVSLALPAPVLDLSTVMAPNAGSSGHNRPSASLVEHLVILSNLCHLTNRMISSLVATCSQN